MIISRMPALAIWIALVASLGTDVTASMSAPAIQGTASVIDGDTIEIRGQRIRLDAIDATESSQICPDANSKRYRCCQKSALALDDMIGGSVVICGPKQQNIKLRYAKSSLRSHPRLSHIIWQRTLKV
jgi:endonuclease YncB( thermonuclease family)